jgi:kynurenine formamidase
MEHVIARSHAGTHVDAPFHFGPTSAGKPAQKIDQIPLEWCYGNGVLLDFSQSKKPGEAITTEDLKKELARIHYILKMNDIVLIRTGAEDYQDDPRYEEMASGLIKESLYWLLDQGIKMIGTDAWTLDRPVPRMFEELKKGDQGAFFPVHYAGRDREYVHAEKFSNLKSLPHSTGFQVAMFPIKIEEGTGAWTRAVAIAGEGTLTKMPEILDLSVPIRSQSMEWYEQTVEQFSAEETGRRYAKRFGISVKLLPTPNLWPADEVSCSSHAGTHVNAPWHYAPIVESQPAKTIDQVPLERCYGDGVLLDFSNKKANEPITAPDLMGELRRIGYELKPGDIVLIRTGAEDFPLDAPNFNRVPVGLSGDAFSWLFDKGITMTGTDAFTTDISIGLMSQRLKGGDKPAYFPLHKGCLTKDSCHAERLYNLKKLPRPFGFKIAIFPIKLENCSGAWTRAVAIF